jgi:hypothetical protein
MHTFIRRFKDTSINWRSLPNREIRKRPFAERIVKRALVEASWFTKLGLLTLR